MLKAVEVIARDLHPHPVLLLRDLVDPHTAHSDRAGLVVQPEVDVVVFILTALATEVRARKIAPVLLELADLLVDLHKLEGELFTRLVILQFVDSIVLTACPGNMLMDGGHHLPGAFLLSLPRMFRGREPPPGNWHACHHGPGVALL